MNWEMLGALGEILGASAVFLSLGYLALQIKHSNAQAQVDAVHLSTNNWVAQHQAAFATEVDVAFMRQAMTDYKSLSQNAKGKFFAVMTGYFAAFDSLYNQHKAGLLPDEVFDALERAFLSVVLTPGVQDFMAELEDTMLPPYIMDYVNGELGPQVPPLLMSDMSFLKMEGDA